MLGVPRKFSGLFKGCREPKSLNTTAINNKKKYLKKDLFPFNRPSKFSGFEPMKRQILNPTIAIALNRSSTFSSFKSIRQITKQKHKKNDDYFKNHKIKTIINISKTLVLLVIIIKSQKKNWRRSVQFPFQNLHRIDCIMSTARTSNRGISFKILWK
jgi:hypothetical protein